MMMNESLSVSKTADAKGNDSASPIHTIQSVLEGPKNDLNVLRQTVQKASCNGCGSTDESVAAELVGMPPAQRASALRGLQQTHGNRYVGRLAVQAKLKLGPVGDRYEQEADRVARQVVQTISSSDRGAVQRQEIEEEEEGLRLKVAGLAPAGGADVGPDLESSIRGARGGGQPLSDGVRQPMERAFGANFGRVRVHTDGEADSMSRSLQARAFTTGQDIFLRQGEFRPGSSEGQKLLAHELTHVVQQRRGRVKPMLQANGVPINDDTWLHGLQNYVKILKGKLSYIVQWILPEIDQVIQKDSALKTVLSNAYTKSHFMITGVVPQSNGEAYEQINRIHDIIKCLYHGLAELADAARKLGEFDFGKMLIGHSDDVYRLLTMPLQMGQVPPPGAPQTSGKDRASTALGIADPAQTLLGGLGGGIFTAPGVTATATTAATAATVVGYIAGPLGALFGAIGVILGAKAIVRGAKKEKEIRAAIPHLTASGMKDVAAYAQEQKRKKKWGGAITVVASAGAVAAGVVGTIALSVSTLGIGAAILGIGVALIGLGIVIGKIVHHFHKRKKYKKSLKNSVVAAVQTHQRGELSDELWNLGTQHEDEQNRDTKRDIKHRLEDACVEHAESKRADVARILVEGLLGADPVVWYDARLILTALGLNPDTLKKQALDPHVGFEGARAKVADKLKSW